MRVLERIISGGQTGADRGGLDAAIGLGIPHGGWCPKGRRAEDGPIPAKYCLKETASSSYPQRTEKNVQESDGTVIFTFGAPEGGSALTQELAKKHGKPCHLVDLKSGSSSQLSTSLREWIEKERIKAVNVAGSRESKAPGIQELVKNSLVQALSNSGT